MICPSCASFKTYVKSTTKGLINMRYRICPKCGYTFTTKEILNDATKQRDYNDYLENIGEITRQDREKADE